MKKEYKTPNSRVINLKAASPLMTASRMDRSGKIIDTDTGFDASFGEDDVDEGN
jgi:hypothetical protein